MKKTNKVICLSASWCMPCKAFHQTVEKVMEMEQYKDIDFKFLDVEDDDEGVELAEKLGIRGVPTTVLYDKDGNIINRLSGNVPMTTLTSLLDEETE